MKKATNSPLMREKNEKIILSLINKEPVSRTDVAKKAGLTKAAVTIMVDDLKKRNIIMEEMGTSDAVGRKPVMLFLNDKAFYMVGINITRRDITMGIVDLCGNIVIKDVLPIDSPNNSFEMIEKTFKEQILKSGIDISKIYKISVVTPGPVDVKKGIILNPPNFKKWHNVSIVEKLTQKLGADVILANISSATAIAEKYFGAAKDNENFLTIRADEGIGSGIVINDNLFKGPCELGHISIKYDGIKCECGNYGCLEKYASISNILAETKYLSWQEAVDNDNSIIEKEAEYLSTAIISANNIFAFDKIVLCGDLTYEPEKIIKFIVENLEKNMLFNNFTQICAGKVKSKLLIAASMAIHHFFT